MNSHRPIITGGQLVILLLVGRLSLTLLYSVDQAGSVSLWEMVVPLLLGVPIGLLLLWPSVQFAAVSRQSASEYSVQQFGMMGRGIALLYGAYFLFSALHSLSILRHFMDDVLPEGVSANVILVLLIAGCLYAAGKDVEAIARTAFLVLWLLAAAVLILVVLLMPNFSASHLTPIRYLSGASVLDGVVLLVSRMNASVTLPIVLPSVKGTFRRQVIMYVTMVSVTVCFLVVLLVGSTGDYLKNQPFPIFRAIDGSGVLQRMDPLFFLVIVCSLFCHVTLLLVAFLRSIRTVSERMTGKRPAGVAGALLLLILLPNSDRFWLGLSPYGMAAAAIFLLTGIPLCLLLHHSFTSRSVPVTQVVRRKKRVLWLLPFLLFGMVGSGCSGLQLNQRIIVQGIGIDRQERGYQLTLLTLDTRDPHQDNAMKIVRAQGDSVADAVHRLEQQSGKQLLLHQCLFMMMNRPAACHADKTLSYFAEMREMPKTTGLMVSEQTSSVTLTTAAEQFGERSEDISALSDSKAVTQPAVHSTLLSYITDHNAQQTALVLPYVVINTATEALNVSGSYWVEGEEGACTLSEEETIGYLLLKGEAGGLLGNAVKAASVTLVPSIQQGRLHLDYHIPLQWKEGTPSSQQQFTRQKALSAAEACVHKLSGKSGGDVLSIEPVLRDSLPLSDVSREEILTLLRNAAYRVFIDTA